MVLVKLKRINTILRSAWNRPMPYGLISIAFLNPYASPKVKRHRKLFCKGPAHIPLLFIILCNIALWLRWIFFIAWRTTYTCVQKYGSEIEATFKISKTQQFTACLALALAHCIPPSAYYRFKFYLTPASRPFWNYIYSNELPAYHLRHDNPGSAKQRSLLSDKQGFANRMRAHGISVAEGQLLPVGYQYAQLPLQHGISKFLKPTVGFGSLGAFSLYIDHTGNPKIRDIKGNHYEGRAAKRHMEALFAKQAYLLQPRYTNHQHFESLLEESDEAITLRIITWWCNDNILPYCAFLEVPILNRDKNKNYLAVQVDCENGVAIADSLDRMIHCDTDVISRYKKKLDNFTVPLWHKCLENNKLAHRQFPDVHSIAWDNIITPDEPILLEGNSNWGIELPQMFCGGIVESTQASTP